MPAVTGAKKGKKNVDAKDDAVEEVKDLQVHYFVVTGNQ